MSVGLALASAAVVSSAEFGRAFAQASAYGHEQRYPLRPPPAYLVAAAAAWMLMSGGRTGWATCSLPRSNGSPALSCACLAIIIAVWSWPRWHKLSRRWLVIVPVGVVIHDHLILGETLMLRRQEVGRRTSGTGRHAGVRPHRPGLRPRARDLDHRIGHRDPGRLAEGTARQSHSPHGLLGGAVTPGSSVACDRGAAAPRRLKRCAMSLLRQASCRQVDCKPAAQHEAIGWVVEHHRLAGGDAPLGLIPHHVDAGCYLLRSTEMRARRGVPCALHCTRTEPVTGSSTQPTADTMMAASCRSTSSPTTTTPVATSTSVT